MLKGSPTVGVWFFAFVLRYIFVRASPQIHVSKIKKQHLFLFLCFIVFLLDIAKYCKRVSNEIIAFQAFYELLNIFSVEIKTIITHLCIAYSNAMHIAETRAYNVVKAYENSTHQTNILNKHCVLALYHKIIH